MIFAGNGSGFLRREWCRQRHKKPLMQDRKWFVVHKVAAMRDLKSKEILSLISPIFIFHFKPLKR